MIYLCMPQESKAFTVFTLQFLKTVIENFETLQKSTLIHKYVLKNGINKWKSGNISGFEYSRFF